MCTGKWVSINACPQTLSFGVTAHTDVHLQSSRFLPVATLKNPVVFSSNWKWRGTSACLIPVKSFATAPKPLKGCDSPCSEVTMRTLIGVKDFWVSVIRCNLVNNKNWSVSKLGTCIVNVLCQLWLKYYIVKVFIVDVSLTMLCNIDLFQ